MIDPNQFELLFEKFRTAMAQTPFAQIESNTKVVMRDFFKQLELATQEELTVYREMLDKLHQRIAMLEAQVAELEQQAHSQAPAAKPTPRKSTTRKTVKKDPATE